MVEWMLSVVDKKVTPKRRRSLAASDVSPPLSGGSGGGGISGTGGSAATGAGGSAVKSKPGSTLSGCQTPRMTVPLSERQQLALLMQMTAEEQPTSGQPPFSFRYLILWSPQIIQQIKFCDLQIFPNFEIPAYSGSTTHSNVLTNEKGKFAVQISVTNLELQFVNFNLSLLLIFICCWCYYNNNDNIIPLQPAQ